MLQIGLLLAGKIAIFTLYLLKIKARKKLIFFSKK